MFVSRLESFGRRLKKISAKNTNPGRKARATDATIENLKGAGRRRPPPALLRRLVVIEWKHFRVDVLSSTSLSRANYELPSSFEFLLPQPFEYRRPVKKIIVVWIVETGFAACGQPIAERTILERIGARQPIYENEVAAEPEAKEYDLLAPLSDRVQFESINGQSWCTHAEKFIFNSTLPPTLLSLFLNLSSA